MYRAFFAVSVCVAVACGGGGGGGGSDDATPQPPMFDAAPGPMFDAGPTIDGMGMIDAAPELPDSGLTGVVGDPTQQVTSASGKVTGGGFTVEVQFGHPAPQQAVTGGDLEVSGSTPLKP